MGYRNIKWLQCIALAVGLAAAQQASAQDFRQQFKTLFDKGDFAGQQRVLKEWEASKPDDPEMFVSYFNFYFAKSKNEAITLTPKPGSNASLAVTKEGSDKVVAYLGSDVTFDKADVDSGLAYIDRGIAKHPDRLDMRFGKTYVLGQIRAWERFAGEIVKTVERSNVIKNQWLWRDGKAVERPKEMMLGSIQDYVVQLFDAGDEEVKHIKSVAETVLRFYPEHIESLSNLSVYHMVNKEFDQALVALLKAEAVAPADHVIIGNIVFCYFNKHDKQNAIKYYEKLRQIGDESAKKDATAKLAEIKAWKEEL